jgi:hypothetical protein
VRGCTDIYSSVFAVVLVEYFSFHRRDATRFSAKGCFNCRHLLAASAAAKTVSRGCSAVVPKAVAGASGAYRVAVGKRYQAVYTLYHLCKQLSSREMAWQPQISSAQASTRSVHLQRGARQLGGQPGASSPWSDKHNCARNRSLIAG